MQYLDPSTGIAGLDHEPDAALVGVFLTDKAPKPPTPARMNLAVTGLDFKKLKPHIAQVFFIGDGRTGFGTGRQQRFIVPKGATRLFLGVSDGFAWYNNTGQITATITQTAP